jgi:drug/metabolite transporter (DMT)-like permease
MIPHPTPSSSTLAVSLMLLATAFIAATTLLAKALGTETLGAPLHPVQVTSGRFGFALLAIGTGALVVRLRFARVHWRLHIARTALGASGVTLMFAAAAMIPLADATAISFLNPIFAMLLAIPLLGERVGPWRWGAVALAFAGAVILLRPGAGVIEAGALLALGAAAFMGLEVIVIKRLSGLERPFQLLLVNNAIGLCLIAGPAVFVWQPPSAAQWGALAGLGVLMACAQACFVNAMARADASFVVPFSYATLLFAAAYDALIFDVWPDWVSALGAGIILAAALLQAWREARRRRDDVAGASPPDGRRAVR